MYLKTLKLRDFAGLASADLGALEPGLNVVVGDNEAGKSTLLKALRAAFFLRHRSGGEATAQLSSYGRQASPEIRVEFDLGGAAYSLEKSFLKGARAELSWAEGRLSGDAVEERLAELLRFSPFSGRGEWRRDAHHGAFGLLWVEQGRSPEGLDLGAGRDAVTASLEGEVGRILGGERGRALLVAAKTLQDRFFTDGLRAKTGSPLKDAEERLAAREAELGVRQAAWRDYEAKIDRLRSRRETLGSYMRDDAVAVAERALELAEMQSRTLSGAEREWQDAERDLGHAATRRDAAAERLRTRERLGEALRETEGAGAAAALAELRDEHGREVAALARLEAEREAALTAFDAAERAGEAAAAHDERQRALAAIADLERRVAEAGTLEARLAEIAESGAGPVLDRKGLEAIETAERQRREAEIRLSATAPTVVFEPAEGRRVRDEAGVEAPIGAAVPVLRRMAFDLEGFGRLRIEPGEDSGALRRAFDEAGRAVRHLMERHRVASLEEARRIAREGEERAAAASLVRTQLSGLLPEGAAEARASLDAHRAALARLGTAAEAPEGLPGDTQSARALRQAARAHVETSEAACAVARRQAGALAARLAKAEAESEHRAAAVLRLRREMAEAEAARATAALREDLAAAEVERAAKAAVAALRRRAVDETDPETVERTLQARRRALEEIRRTVAGLKEETIALESELRVQGATALGEEIAGLGEEIAALRDRRRRLALEADAVRLLHSTLVAAQREARDHWLGPIKAQVAPYLRLIQPESEIELDDATLEIRSLRRRGMEEDFKRLSTGAREQVAVVTRLALADVLKRGGHPAVVILDDALVNTDEKRLERMHLVLQKAAEGLQIIVLTCRERDFRGLGAPIFRL